MASTQFDKKPPVYDRGVRGDATSYLKQYGLFVQRIMWACENRNPNLPERDLKRYISQLVDPLAFRGGYTDEVEKVERIMDGLNEGEITESFRIKTIVRQEGTHGGILKRKKSSLLWTVLNIGYKPRNISTITVPNNQDVNWTELEVTTTEWNDTTRSFLSGISEGDSIELYIGPSETGKFEFGFEFSRE